LADHQDALSLRFGKTLSLKSVSNSLRSNEKPEKGESMAFVWWVIVGLIAGWATGKIMSGAGYGPIMDIVIGIIGAVVGGWIMRDRKSVV
jgi:hypothetical protein